MPLLFNKEIDSNTRIGLWKIDETKEQLKSLTDLDAGEEDQYASFKSDVRKKQWLSCRILLREMLDDESPVLEYDEFGKPGLKNSNLFLSISHSGDYSAVITSKSTPVGIDIEHITDRIHRISERFLSAGEDRNQGEPDRLDKLYIVWGAKESLYKIQGRPEVDFQRDIFIDVFDYLCGRNGKSSARMTTPDGVQEYEIFYERISGYMLVYALKMNTDR